MKVHKNVKWIVVSFVVVLLCIAKFSYIGAGGSPVFILNSGNVVIYTTPVLPTSDMPAEGVAFRIGMPNLGGLQRFDRDSRGNISIVVPFWVTLLISFVGYYAVHAASWFISASRDDE